MRCRWGREFDGRDLMNYNAEMPPSDSLIFDGVFRQENSRVIHRDLCQVISARLAYNSIQWI
jgi:uncharacterized protein involved in propanediol utilization